MRLARAILQVKSVDASRAFYCDRLGMQVVTEHIRLIDGDEETHLTLGFEPHGPQAALELVGRAAWTKDPATRYRPAPGDRYWKIGITLPQVDLARDRLLDAGVAIGVAGQFRDVGYLCHLSDPDGYVIELLQHRFEANHTASPPDPDHTLGSRPTIGQVSLRIRDAETSLAFYTEQLGLRLLSRQRVDPPGFTLYFLADTDDVPPHADLEAVANREWLWQRPYTTLELQHRWTQDPSTPSEASDGSLGFVALCFESGARGQRTGAGQTMQDPDGNRLRIVGAD